MYIKRIVTERLLTLFRNSPVVVVTGARQTGKTTLLQHVLDPPLPAVVFDPVVDVAGARQDPDLFLDTHPPPLVLDEIQYAPELVAAVKRRVDRNPVPGQYLMAGSQRWGVLSRMAESLAGRVLFLDLEGFCSSEIAAGEQGSPVGWLDAFLTNPETALKARWSAPGGGFALYEQLWRGFLPRVQFVEEAAVPAFHSGYRQTYIERDVRLVANIADLHDFGRFFSLACALTAQEINRSQFGRELGVTPQTARRWLDVLRETCQWHEASAFSGNAVKRVTGKPKGCASDTGLCCAALAISTPGALAGHPALGALFETAVVADIRRQGAALGQPPLFHHWRSAGGAEVDVLLERDGMFFPMEIKAATRIGRNDARGISAFKAAYPHLRVAHGLILAPVKEPFAVTPDATAFPWNAVPV
jgi:predicted AAA+ superfamily ATPase